MESSNETTIKSEYDRGGVVPDWGPIRSAPEDKERAEHAFDLQFGDIVHEAGGHSWVFIGWRRNSAGLYPWFTRQQTVFEEGEPLTYHAAIAETVERKFPDIVQRRKRQE